MAHRKFGEKFYGENAEESAKKYADKWKGAKDPSNEVYVYGPFFDDEDNYWCVEVEMYT